MSTRSIVAFATEGAIQGVYVHYDGMPDTMLPELVAIAHRDGVIVMGKTLLEHPAWASIEAGDPSDPSSTSDNPLFTPGYGRRFPREHEDKPFTPDQLAEWWDSEFIYVLDADRHVIRYAHPGVRSPGGPENEWDAQKWTEVPL